jgi:predicted secreted hydrolase
MNWVSAAPACKVMGSLTINGEEYNLDGVRGYHDHNWGNWSWNDNIGWDWGQAIEMNNDEPDTDVGRYTIVLRVSRPFMRKYTLRSFTS